MSYLSQTFERLTRQAAACTFCPRMADQRAVLGPDNGTLDAELLFVAEAPGRFGSARTGVPFSGDRSGDHFETLIAHAGFSRDRIFITNAVLCNPLKEGRNHRPSTQEIDNCALYLRAVLGLVRPRVVATLGTVGLEAINRLLSTRYRLAENVARALVTPDFYLVPLYHPSPRVTNWRRPLAQQKRDFMKLRRLVDRIRNGDP